MSLHATVRPFGPWATVKNLFNDLPKNLRELAISSQRSVAEKYIRKIKKHLDNQDIPGWTPLSPKYADFKMGKYGHEDILIASWEYYENIKVWRSNNLYFAGVPRGIHYPNGNEVARIAYIHEMWSTTPGKPYRPLWNYTIKEDMGGVKGIKKMVNEIFYKKLKEKGYKPIKLF